MSLEGQQLGRYRIVRLLGSGGMGEVYLAEDARIEQQVAIKVIRAEVSPYPGKEVSQEAARLFQREAKAIAKLDHPHILPLYDYGEERLGNMTVIYLVMPYRREGSLSDWLRGRNQAGFLSAPEVAHIVRQAASALQHAHTRLIIHQDVKPANFLIHSNEEDPNRPGVLLADFGIARFSSATSSMSHTIRGTPTYMAPEQWSGEPGPAADQYALAIMAYELVAGRPPFQGPPMRLMHLHATTPPPPPSTFNPRLTTDMDMVLLHALAKQPEQRFASMIAFANAFEQAAQDIQEPNVPGRMAVPPPPVSAGDIRTVLAISTMEAQTGTTRTLTLPGGRQVLVPVPAGVRDGQIVRLDGQGEASLVGGATGALILTIQVIAAQEVPSLSTGRATLAEETVLTANSTAPATSASNVSGAGQQATVRSAATTEQSTPTTRSSGSKGKTSLVIVLVLLLVIGSGVGIFHLINSGAPSFTPASSGHITSGTSLPVSSPRTPSLTPASSGHITSIDGTWQEEDNLGSPSTWNLTQSQSSITGNGTNTNNLTITITGSINNRSVTIREHIVSNNCDNTYTLTINTTYTEMDGTLVSGCNGQSYQGARFRKN